MAAKPSEARVFGERIGFRIYQVLSLACFIGVAYSLAQHIGWRDACAIIFCFVWYVRKGMMIDDD